MVDIGEAYQYVKYVFYALMFVAFIYYIFIERPKAKQEHLPYPTIKNPGKSSPLPEDKQQQVVELLKNEGNTKEKLYKLYDLLLHKDVNDSIFHKYNTQQRALYIFSVFQGQVNNGGTYQFFWNCNNMIYAAKETLLEINIYKLFDSYSKCLEEFEGHVEDFKKDRKIWASTKSSHEQKMTAFGKGRAYIPSGEKLESYFFSNADEVTEKVINYINKNLAQLGVEK